MKNTTQISNGLFYRMDGENVFTTENEHCLAYRWENPHYEWNLIRNACHQDVYVGELFRKTSWLLSQVKCRIEIWEQSDIELYKSKPFRKEINVIRRTNYYRSVNTTLYYISSKIIIFVTFLIYVVTGNTLTSEKVKKSIKLFSSQSMSVEIKLNSDIQYYCYTYLILSNKSCSDKSSIQRFS